MTADPTGESPIIEETSAGLTWIADPTEPIQRASHALDINGQVWLVDPVENSSINDAIESLGDVAGVTVLLDRHTRDADAFARRYDVSIFLPDVLADAAEKVDAKVEWFEGELATSGYRSRPLVSNRFWREAALVSDNGETVVVPEALGTVNFYRAPGERVGVHPGLRLWPPRRQLSDLDPDQLLVGHGSPVLQDAGTAVQDTLAGARRRAPRAFWQMVTDLL